ncbi:conserved hypothetical protein [Dethiosulfovibrio peptidovorans DSM 11002]|uniref:DUF7033 domain-containing protein n=1 Tax=Dethiosulfovibrio peptidovorans DSM 11002 TaxID=469381 RepID=D2Z5R9_9BACT|nr:polysaccharide deacetylase family protein [Dethiosulfovibrio peptidovorans]EFC90816.1 conserved hypothetical protein [Dethiosulfovibrio peptidovorans DSM 11002]
MSLLFNTTNAGINESLYVMDLLLNDFLGLSMTVSGLNSPYVRISVGGDDSRALLVKNILEPWNGGEAIPWEAFELRCLPMEFCGVIPKPEEKNLPVLTVKGSSERCSITRDGDIITLDFDLFTTAFYILSRVEESVNPERDSHDRFPASASHALKNGYLHRPVVNEMVEILCGCLKVLWPGLERKKREFQIKLTHDVDSPFEVLFSSVGRVIKSMGGDVIKRRDVSRALSRGLSWFRLRFRGDVRLDSAYSFDLIMDIGEQHGIVDDFYFIPLNTSPFDGNYKMTDTPILNLMKHIKNRGHNVGFHGSYETYKDPERVKKEVRVLKEAASSIGIEQQVWGGRQHYLRWEAPTTWRAYSEAGLNYDTTLSFADHSGFRCGTCYPYQVFDFKTRKALDLWEYPLIVMECTVLAKKYMNLPIDKAYDYISCLKKACLNYDGVFTMLWHNDHLCSNKMIDLYRKILEE